MKKKSVIILLIAIIIGLAFAAQVSAQTKLGPRTEAFLKTFSSGNYHMKAYITEGGTRSDIELFTKGGKIASTVVSRGQTVRMILKDNKTYMIMDSTKMILITAMQDASQTGTVDTSKMAFTGSGTASFAGKNLPYEEYTEGHDKAQFFIDGNKLAGIRSITSAGQTVDTVITVLDQAVPDNVFNVPSTGYQVQDMSSLKF